MNEINNLISQMEMNLKLSINNIENEYKNLYQDLSMADKEISDILHYIEDFKRREKKLDMYTAWVIISDISRVLERRRIIKTKCKQVKYIHKFVNFGSNIKNRIKQLKETIDSNFKKELSNEYHPRIRTDLKYYHRNNIKKHIDNIPKAKIVSTKENINKLNAVNKTGKLIKLDPYQEHMEELFQMIKNN